MKQNDIKIFNIDQLNCEFQKNLNFIEKKKVLKRIWDKDGSLWQLDDRVASQSLGWLNLPEQAELIAEISTTFAQEALNKYEVVCLVGMGGSIFGAKAIIDFVDSDNSKIFAISDSTLPASINMIEKIIKGKKTVFVIASKSGTTKETLLIYNHLKKIGDSNGNLFVAITDPDTFLYKEALRQKFHKTFLGFQDVGGRYSALSYFGLLPSALMGCQTDLIVKASQNMKTGLQQDTLSKHNLAAIIASILGACVVNKTDKLTFISSQGLDSFSSWLEQLIAESIGKQNMGLVPVVKEPLLDIDSYSGDRVFLYIRYERGNNEINDRHVQKLVEAKFPVLWIDVEELDSIGGQLFLWEFVISILGALLKLNPFDQTDVEKTKIKVSEVINNIGKSLQLPFCDDLTILSRMLGELDAGAYVSLLIFMSSDNEQTKYVKNLRKKISDKYKLTTTVGIGPGYLHSTGQLLKGGRRPDHSIFFVHNGNSNLYLPEDYALFNQVTIAQVCSEIEIFKSLGVESTCIDVSEGSKFKILDLVSSI